MDTEIRKITKTLKLNLSKAPLKLKADSCSDMFVVLHLHNLLSLPHLSPSVICQQHILEQYLILCHKKPMDTKKQNQHKPLRLQVRREKKKLNMMYSISISFTEIKTLS